MKLKKESPASKKSLSSRRGSRILSYGFKSLKRKFKSGQPKGRKISTTWSRNAEESPGKYKQEITLINASYHRWQIKFKEYAWIQFTSEYDEKEKDDNSYLIVQLIFYMENRIR